MDKEDVICVYTHTHTHTHTHEYYSAIKKEILSLAATWMDLEDVLLSEKKVRERQVVNDFTYM